MDPIISTRNPGLVVSPTPKVVYQPRFWKGRIWVKGGPFQGVGFLIRCPYGVAANAAEILQRAAARGQITRYTFGPMPADQLKHLSKEYRNAPGLRYEPVFDNLAANLHIDWAA
jgi:hypothetical protein